MLNLLYLHKYVYTKHIHHNYHMTSVHLPTTLHMCVHVYRAPISNITICDHRKCLCAFYIIIVCVYECMYIYVEVSIISFMLTNDELHKYFCRASLYKHT